jgi:signal peptidase II
MHLNWRNLLLIFLPVVLVTVVDLSLKQLILSLDLHVQLGVVKIAATANKGIIGGYFSDSAKPIFQIPMIALGFFVLVLLYFIQLFAPVKSKLMRVAISLFFGGTFANVADRFNHGYVVDYLQFKFFNCSTPTFNLADVVQFAGIGIIFYLQSQPSTFDDSGAQNLWVSKQFQKRYSAQLVATGFGLVAVLGVLSYAFVRVVMGELAVVPEIKAQFLQAYLLFFVCMSITFLLFLYLVGKALSAYVAKPILTFEHYLRRLAGGDYNVIHIDEPEFSYLENLSDGVRDHIVGLHEQIRRSKIRTQTGGKE